MLNRCFNLTLDQQFRYALSALKKQLDEHSVNVSFIKQTLLFSKNSSAFSFEVAGEDYDPERSGGTPVIPFDELFREPAKTAALVLSKLKLNQVVFARNCEVKKTERKTAEEFLNQYHLMNATQSGFNMGLYFRNELIALASFSKGRKMRRLPDDERSFELIRFCCKSGISVAGGLTKLASHFCSEKKAGDIMSYVNKQLSDGESFLKAGFKKTGETAPYYFLVNRKTFVRTPAKKEEVFDHQKYYLSQNSGNVKLVYTPKKTVLKNAV